jgi:hypothetical protein
MAVNLLRNSRVFYTNLTKAQVLADTAVTANNTWELLPMSDFTFSQGTEQQTITLNEAGATPSRGQRSFNTAINPVDWSFGTYVRPTRLDLPTDKTCAPELLMWNAIASAARPTSGDAATAAGGYAMSGTWTDGSVTGAVTVATDDATVNFQQSNVHSFTEFGLIFEIDATIYYLDKCSINQAELNFGIDQIASISWSGQATELVEITNIAGIESELTTVSSASSVWEPTAAFLTNKLAKTTIQAYSLYGQSATKTYALAITGGQVTISNNINYLTPELLGVVNKPIGYYSGTRSISGNMTAYLKTGTTETGALLSDLAAHSQQDSDNKFYLRIGIGEAKALSNTNPWLQLIMPSCVLQIPTIDVQDVVSTTINFTAQSRSVDTYDPGTYTYDIDKANELQIKYSTAV